MEINSNYRTFTFNKIYVIESIPDDEMQTGVTLYEDLLKWSSHLSSDTCAEYWGVQNKKQFELCLEALYIDTVFGCDPLIHFEVHGSSNYDGLILKSKELVTWDELAQMTRKINQSVKNNLIVSFATCYSGYFIKAIDISKPAPFHGSIITLELLSISEIEIRFHSFFSSLLLNPDFDLAIQNLNETNGFEWKLSFLTAEDAFDILFKRVINECILTNPKGKSWYEEVVTLYSNDKNELVDRVTSESEIREAIFMAIAEEERNLKNSFLLIEG